MRFKVDFLLITNTVEEGEKRPKVQSVRRGQREEGKKKKKMQKKKKKDPEDDLCALQ